MVVGTHDLNDERQANAIRHIVDTARHNFNLEVNGKVIANGTRGDLLEWVDSYYVKRAGYKKVALDWWKREVDGVTVATVRLVFAR